MLLHLFGIVSSSDSFIFLFLSLALKLLFPQMQLSIIERNPWPSSFCCYSLFTSFWRRRLYQLFLLLYLPFVLWCAVTSGSHLSWNCLWNGYCLPGFLSRGECLYVILTSLEKLVLKCRSCPPLPSDTALPLCSLSLTAPNPSSTGREPSACLLNVGNSLSAFVSCIRDQILSWLELPSKFVFT